MIALVFALALAPTPSLPLAAPVNDLCANATPIECNAQTTGTIAEVNTDVPTFDDAGVDCESVFYLLTLPPGQWQGE